MARKSEEEWSPIIRELDGGVFQVQSASDLEVFYEVNLSAHVCTCPDHTRRLRDCKHLRKLEMYLESLPFGYWFKEKKSLWSD